MMDGLSLNIAVRMRGFGYGLHDLLAISRNQVVLHPKLNVVTGHKIRNAHICLCGLRDACQL